MKVKGIKILGKSILECDDEETPLIQSKNIQVSKDISGFRALLILLVCVGIGVLGLISAVTLRSLFGPRYIQLDTYLSTILSKSDTSNEYHTGKNYENARNFSSSGTICKTKVYLIRHADKGHDPVHLTIKGRERATHLLNLFCSTDEKCPFQAPIKMYARAPERPMYVMRSVETLEPLSSHLNVPINIEFGKRKQWQLVNRILSDVASKKMCGQAILVCWKHTLLPLLMQDLGCHWRFKQETPCRAFDWKGHDFDSIAEMEYSYNSSSPQGMRWKLQLIHNYQEFEPKFHKNRD
mmetsp:Transcript_7880/g.14292  ORF Transcript_7880/g.14292 Transcript_7880/m.14292 type:complete len:295 (+) Transcript_7880:146-1030(+)